MRGSKLLVVPVVAALLLVSCGGGNGDDTATTSTESASGTPVQVHTAAQLEDIVTKVAQAYETENPDANVQVTTVADLALVAPLGTGEPDVSIVPDPWLDTSEGAFEAIPFGRTLAVIAVPEDNTAGVEDVTAFAADSGLRTAVCANDSDMGNFGLLVLRTAGVTPDPATIREGCEAEVLEDLAAGDLDAGLMFRQELEVPEGVKLLEIPEEDNVVLGVSTVLGDSSGAAAFGEFLASDTVRDLLTENSFLP